MNTRRRFLRYTIAGAAALAAGPLAVREASARDFRDGDRYDLDDAVEDSGGPSAQTIDWHTHWLSPQTVEILKQRKTAPLIETNSDGSLRFVTGTGDLSHGLKLAPEFTNVAARLKEFDRSGIGRQIISWPTTLGADALLSPADARELWTAYNDDLSALVKQYPDRFSGVAALPTSDIVWAAQELDRAHTQLGLIGAVLPAGALQSLEGGTTLTPILEVAQKHGSHIYVHTGPASPTIPGQPDDSVRADDAPVARATLNRALSFARVAVTTTETSLLDPYPDITVQIAMLGGATSVLSSWLLYQRRGPQTNDPSAPLKKVYYDTGVFGRSPELVEVAVATLGADRLLFGSDFPLAPTNKTIASIRDASILAPDKQQIFVENGRSLYAKITGSPAPVVG